LLKGGLLGAGSELPKMSITFGPASSSVLAAFGAAFGKIPPILLRDADSETEPGPVIRPSSPEIPDPADRSARLQLFGEIARGGMGAVFKGRDSDLGRDLAVKILLEAHRDKPDMIRRFIEEAQIAGQLQHPGIVPIYELGAFGDRRPYFAMKLVKGQTLAEILAKRRTSSDGLPRFLSIFESICQTMAYAHARGVIHRDLKPSNVMVGSFGEVQVMDWGLAKVLPRGGAVEDASAGQTKDQGTVIATARSGSDSDLSQAGSVMGTPSYMAPEQARGEINQIDERADVFALGSIFCELLTGDPAFTGRNSGEIQRKAALGNLADALARLDEEGRGHDPELISLAKSCLAPERDYRPRNAGELAERVTNYLVGMQEKLRRAEIASVEERARRRLTTVVLAALISFGLAGGSGYIWVQQQRVERNAQTDRFVTEALNDASRLLGEAKAAPTLDMEKWADAFSAEQRAEGLLGRGEASSYVQGRVAGMRMALESERDDAVHRASEADRDRKFLERLEIVRKRNPSDYNPGKIDSDYATAFRDFGIDPDRLDPKEAGRLLRERTRPLEITLLLDDWALTRRSARGEKDKGSWRRLIATARAADPDPWREKLRKLIDGGSHEAVRRLAADQEAIAVQPARSLYLLANVLEVTRDDGDHVTLEESFEVLKRAWRLSPSDYLICQALSEACNGRPLSYKARPWATVKMDRIRFATAAVAANPLSAHSRASLAEALVPILATTSTAWMGKWPRPVWGFDPEWVDAEDLNDAIAEYREAIRIDPTLAYVRRNLGNVLMLKGEIENAVAEYREAARLDPKDPDVHMEAAFRLYLRGRLDLAIAELQEAIRLEPASERSHIVLGIMYHEQGKLSQASAAYRQALRLGGHYGGRLRHALEATGKPEEVLDAYREALRLHPKNPELHHEVGEICSEQGRTQEALAEYDAEIALLRERVDHNRNVVKVHVDLGEALFARGHRDEAFAEFHEAIKLKPKDTDVLKNVAWFLATSPHTKQRDGKAAVEFATKACELTEWKNPDYLNTLAVACAESGDFDAAVKWQTKAIELLTDKNEKGDYSTRLRLYQEKKPYHLPVP